MDKKEKTFEQLLAGIDEILKKLEYEDLDLEESLKLYEQGMNNYRDATEKLGAARARLARLVSVNEDGAETTEDLHLDGNAE